MNELTCVNTHRKFRVRISRLDCSKHGDVRLFLEHQSGTPVTYIDLSPYDMASLEKEIKRINLDTSLMLSRAAKSAPSPAPNDFFAVKGRTHGF